jgi:putative transposase
MKRRKFTEEKIFQVLKEAESSKSIAAVCRTHGITAVTFYRWRTKYEGMKLSEGKRLKEIEDENRRLKKLVADLSLDIQGLKEIIKKKL